MAYVREYKADGEYIAKQDFVYDGRSFTAGESFPWRTLGVAPRSVFMLWQACRIECDFSTPKPEPKPEPKAVNVQRKR